MRLACLGHRQGVGVRLPRITLALNLRELAALDATCAHDIEDVIADYVEDCVRTLWPLSRAISIDHWHIGPHATAGPEAPPPGSILVEVCVTLLPAEAVTGAYAVATH